MRYSVIFTPEALEQLESLYRYVSAAASPEIAQRYTSAIVMRLPMAGCDAATEAKP